MVIKSYENNKNILLTRPINASQKTMTELLSKGYCVFQQPLSTIEPCAFQLPDNIEHYDGLCATSRAAFLPFSGNDKAQKYIDPQLAHIQRLPLFCVGQQTAKAAQKAGFSAIATISMNAEELIQKIILTPYIHFLYLAGKQRLPLLEEGLSNNARHIDCIETYDRKAIIPPLQKGDNLPIFKAVLLYSTIGLDGLHILNEHFDKKTQFLCLSKRIKDALAPHYQAQSLIADEPYEESLFKLL